MRYTKACDVFPKDLILLIQDYIDGEYLYIPRKQNNTKGWGEVNGTKRDLNMRNSKIYSSYKAGTSISTLAEHYYLSENTIRKIICTEKHKVINT